MRRIEGNEEAVPADHTASLMPPVVAVRWAEEIDDDNISGNKALGAYD